MCERCGKDTHTGLKEIDGLCIRCIYEELRRLKKCYKVTNQSWRQMAGALDELLDAIQDLKTMYGNKLYAAPAAIERIFEAADRVKEV